METQGLLFFKTLNGKLVETPFMKYDENTTLIISYCGSDFLPNDGYDLMDIKPGDFIEGIAFEKNLCPNQRWMFWNRKARLSVKSVENRVLTYPKKEINILEIRFNESNLTTTIKLS